jgi:thioredoxin-related protein
MFTLPLAKDLAYELSLVASRQEPLIVMVSLEGCAFCKIARENYLRAVQQEQKLRIVQLDMHKSMVTIDFAGRSTTHDQLIKTWGIKVAPTILFFGKHGKELVERLAGGSASDFYGAYLDERIAKAMQLSKS